MDPPEQIKRKCSRLANPLAISLLGAKRLAKMFLARMRELYDSHLWVYEQNEDE